MTEMTGSTINARNGEMPPPAGLKRKTLTERAGDPHRKPPPPVMHKSINATGSHRQPSFASSVASSRPSSVSSSRNVSGASFTSTMSSASRPSSSQSYRSQSAMATTRIQRPQPGHGRALSLVEAHGAAPSSGRAQGNRNGRDPFLSTPVDHTETLESFEGKSSYDTQAISDWASSGSPVKSQRNVSLSTAMDGLSFKESSLGATPIVARNRDTSIATAMGRWDVEDKLSNFEKIITDFTGRLEGAATENYGMRDLLYEYKARVQELDSARVELAQSNETLRSNLDAHKADLAASSIALEDSKRYHNIRLDDIQRQHHRDIEDYKREAQDEIDRLERQHILKNEELQKRLDQGLEEEKARHQQELQALTSAGFKSQEVVEAELEKQKAQLQMLEDEIRRTKADVECERNLNSDLRVKLSESVSNTINLESSIRSLRAHVEFLESDNKSQSHAFSDLDNRLQNAIKAAEEAKAKLQIEETLRRKLHNQVQELKGNIRVFCRVRPTLEADPLDGSARINYPDHDSDAKEVELLGPEEKNSLGKISTKTNAFNFDRVFGPGSANADVFGEISQLVQSALDGYNVCIFCYGQTGSGKTYTMSAQDGMIPRAVNQIYDTAKSLEEKGWKYTMEGSFLEVYNENLNDLLGEPGQLDKKKYEIRHDMQKCKTTITDIVTVPLDGPNKVESILKKAASNRSVAATKANERSSRSHSVFILKLTGENSTTGEKSEGTLNLVDLAGSERLSHSQATGERLKETQSINKSLSCLGDVIGALGSGKEGGHVPYRNSKLTYLLQFSLGGNSKTLMFVMISPLQAHLGETLTSLKFATKVHNTHIGTAKRQAKA
ncbi:MAG: hypothetical protein L6R37_001160 [Teloschistes peruensis]|nr:MAG: hypothetical protein L6R37_001160 [Teloschistes peruensis]